MSVDPTEHDAASWIKDAWNSVTNGISGAFGTNSIWSQVILGAAIGVTLLAGTYGAYQLGKFTLNKIADKQLTSDILKKSNKFYKIYRSKILGNGVEGVVYQYNGWAYKTYKCPCYNNSFETCAQRDARVLNNLSINKKAGFSAKAVGKYNLILKLPIVNTQNLITNAEAELVFKAICTNDKRYFYDANPNNIGFYSTPTGEIRQVVFDVGQIITFAEPRSPTSEKLLKILGS